MGIHRENILAEIRESCSVKQSFPEELLARIETFAERAAQAVAAGSKIVFFGNGGSAADAQHLAAELVVRLCADRPAMASLSLTTNTSVLTAAGNDLGFEKVFERQVEALVFPGDVLVALSTSGKSPNIIRAMDAGARKGAFRVAMTGETGGELASRADLLLNVPSRNAQRIQESHIMIGHIVCSIIEQTRFGPPQT
jgi:D-sedoheptulose 7-phosphate isomerase